MKLLANVCYRYQFFDRNRNTMTKYLNGEKTNVVNKSKQVQELNHVDNPLYDFELAKAEIEHQDSIIVEFFILPYENLRMLELYYNFSLHFVM